MKPISYIILIAAIFGLISCNSYKKLTYLQNLEESKGDSIHQMNQPQYTLQPSDILYIRITTPNQSLNRLFNPLNSGSQNQNSTPRGQSGLYYTGYIINDSGYIDIPVIDSIQVMGLTISEARDLIKQKAKRYLKDAKVIVRLGNYRFTVMGEVKSPGTKFVYDNRVNLMEAISYAGDITYNGNRENILVIRPTKDGSKTFRVDMTNKKLLGSREFFIMPNDIIYVEPTRTTLLRERTSDYMFMISALSSTVSAILLLLNAVQ